MTNIVRFLRKRAKGSWQPNKRRYKNWRNNSRWTRHELLWQIRTLVLVALIEGLALQYAINQGLTNSNNFEHLASNTTMSKATTTSVRFELCGQGIRTNCVVDGDTIWYGGVKIRLAEIDAPEIHDYKCASELALGERSKRRLLDLMNAGPFELVRSDSRDADKYGRKLREIVRDGKSVGDILIAEGLASP